MWSERRRTESREQGVGTRDREAGSREQGAGSRESKVLIHNIIYMKNWQEGDGCGVRVE